MITLNFKKKMAKAVAKELRDKLLAIHARTLRGEGEEKTVAKRLLDEQLKRHGLKMSDLIPNDVRRWRVFYVEDWYLPLFRQVAISLDAKVFEGEGLKMGAKQNKTLCIKLNLYEMAEFELLSKYEFYKTLYDKQIDEFNLGFFYNNDLFASYAPNYEQKPESEEKESDPAERAKHKRAISMMQWQEKGHFKRPLGAGSD